MRRLIAVSLALGLLALVASEAIPRYDLISLCLAGLERVTPESLWRAWSLAPEVVVPLLAALAAFIVGSRHVPRARAQRGAFIAGWTLLAAALVSPLCRLSATLVSAHMVQFMLLITAAPILIVLARPGAVLAAALPGARWLSAPIPPPGLKPTVVAYGAAIWLWHVPAVYFLMLTSAVAHVAGLAILVATAVLFWQAVFAARRQQALTAAIALLATMAHTGLLAAVITFASRPLYPILAPGAAAWGLTPLQDQQLAGLIMWVPGGMVFMIVALVLLAAWLEQVSLKRGHSAATGSVEDRGPPRDMPWPEQAGRTPSVARPSSTMPKA